MSAYHQDPIVIFTILVVLAPIFLHVFEYGFAIGAQAGLVYLLSPTMLASYAYLFAIIYYAHAAPNLPKLSPRDQTVALWFLMNGVYYNLFLDVVSGQFQMNGLMTFQYNNVEPRYQFGPADVRGQSVFWTSMCELFFQSPFCILVYIGYVQGRPWRRPLEIVVGCLHIAGVWWFYVPEAFAGFPHLGGWPAPHERFTFERIFYFYFGFWFMGGLWVTAAFFIGRTAFFEISSIIEASEKPKKKKST